MSSKKARRAPAAQADPDLSADDAGSGRLGELEELFDQTDSDGDRTIDLLEFKSMMRELDPEMSAQDAEIGFREIDVDHDGEIDFDEFRAWWDSN
jgi:Ca2+-binding EF-hand superfamily protein